MLKINTPLTLTLDSNVLDNRDSKAIFVRKHDSEANLKAVKTEAELIPQSNSNSWLFLLEGYKKYSTVENLYLDEFVNSFEIKTEDPIVNPFTSDIADTSSIDRLTAALSILTMDYLDLIEEHEIEKLNGSQVSLLFNKCLDIVAKSFRISAKELKKEFLKLQWRNEEALAKELLLLSEKRKQLISESNSQSRRQLERILDINRHPNLFIMSGIEHATIFTQ